MERMAGNTFGNHRLAALCRNDRAHGSNVLFKAPAPVRAALKKKKKKGGGAFTPRRIA